MTVITRHIVERNGVEKMTFANKKDADAYDKELDIADALVDYLNQQDLSLPLNEEQQEELCLFLARNRSDIGNILKGGKANETNQASPETKAKSKKNKLDANKPKTSAVELVA